MKKTLLIIATALVALAIVLWGAQLYLSGRIDTLLKAKVSEALGSNFEFNYSASHIDLLGNTGSLEDLSLTRKADSSDAWQITLKRAEISGFHWMTLLRSDKIAVDSLLLISPEIKVHTFHVDSAKGKLKSPIGTDSENSESPAVLVQGVRISGGTFVYDPTGPERLAANFESTVGTIQIKDGEPTNLFEIHRASRARVQNLEYRTPDSLYVIRSGEIFLPPDESELTVLRTTLQSTLGRVEFGQNAGWRKSRWHAEIDTLRIARPANFSDSLGVLSNIWLSGVRCGIDKDFRLPWPNRITTMPQEAIAELEIAVQVDTVYVNNGSFAINGIHEGGRQAKIEFSDIGAKLTGFQNTRLDSPCFVFDANAVLMHSAPVAFRAEYRYGPKSPFTVRGHVDQTSLDFADDFLQQAAGIRIDQGRLKRLELVMHGNNIGEGGYVDFLYGNLKIKAVDKATGEDKVVLNILTDLARGFLFWKDNPENNQFRRGTFYMARDKRKGFPAQWTDGLLEGVLKTVSKVDPANVRQRRNNKR